MYTNNYKPERCILEALLRRVLYCGHSTQYIHLVANMFWNKIQVLSNIDGAPFTKNYPLSAFILEYPPSLNLKTGLQLTWTWIRRTTPSGVLYSSLFTDSRLRGGASGGRFGSLLGTNQPGIYWSNNRTFSERISFQHCNEGRACWIVLTLILIYVNISDINVY